MKIELTDENLKSAISEAILALASIDEKGRNALIKEALDTLCATRVVKTYGREDTYPSPIQDQFARAVQALSSSVIDDLVANDPVYKAAIEELARKSIRLMLADDDGKLAAAMSYAMREALTK